MTAPPPISTSGTEDESTQILGRRIWRIFLTSNRTKNARMLGFFPMPWLDLAIFSFVFIGFAVDYYGGNDDFSGFYGSMREWLDGTLFPLISDNLAIGYGLLIFLGFASLAVWQGLSEYCWQTLGYKVQHDIRMDATHSLIRMEASYYDLRQTGVLMSVLSADVNQLEDVISDSSTSIIRIIVTFLTAGLLLILMSWKLAAVLFGPMVLIFPMVYFFQLESRENIENNENQPVVSALYLRT